MIISPQHVQDEYGVTEYFRNAVIRNRSYNSLLSLRVHSIHHGRRPQTDDALGETKRKDDSDLTTPQ
jgi:hypothetical protein